MPTWEQGAFAVGTEVGHGGVAGPHATAATASTLVSEIQANAAKGMRDMGPIGNTTGARKTSLCVPAEVALPLTPTVPSALPSPYLSAVPLEGAAA